MSFSKNMKARRKELGISQIALSARSGVPQSTVSAVERGDRTPTAETMMMLAKGLRCSVDSLLYGEDGANEKPAIDIGRLDDELITLLMNLSVKDVQRVKDFVQGIKAARGE